MSVYIAESLKPYIDRLGLEHPVDYESHGRDMIASSYDPETERHLVISHNSVRSDDLDDFNPKRPFLGSFVHELCHLHLAEKIDSSFSGYTVEGTELDRERFSLAENQVVDIWVNDLFYKNFPELFRAYLGNFAAQSQSFIAKKDWQPLLPPTIPFNLARNEAESLRHDLPQPDFKRLLERAGFTTRELRSNTGRSLHGQIGPDVIRQFGYKTLDRLWDYIRTQKGEVEPNTLSDIAVIRNFLVSVPEIPYDRQEALEMHQYVVNQFCDIGKLALSAKLVDEKPRPVWYID